MVKRGMLLGLLLLVMTFLGGCSDSLELDDSAQFSALPLTGERKRPTSIPFRCQFYWERAWETGRRGFAA